MAVINTVKRIYPGLGSPTVYFSNINAAIINGNTTISCPVGSNVQTNQSGTGPVTCGMVRVKSEWMGTFINTGNVFPNNTQCRVLNIWGDDSSSNVVQLYDGDAFIGAANLNIDRIYFFNSDLPLANINVSLNVQGINSTSATNALFSVEVAAGP
jgi:hypothetical protein